MKKDVSKKKIIKIVIFCVIAVGLLAGLLYLMISDQDYGSPDKLEIGKADFLGRMWIGIQVSILGMGTVFIMLILLILCVNILKYIMSASQNIAKKKEQKKLEMKKTQAIEAPVVSDNASEDEEVVAVITAALTAYYDAQKTVYKSNLKFRVRSIKEI